MVCLAAQFRLASQRGRGVKLVHDEFYQLYLVRLREGRIVEQIRKLVFRTHSIRLSARRIMVLENIEKLGPAPVRDVIVFPEQRIVRIVLIVNAKIPTFPSRADDAQWYIPNC